MIKRALLSVSDKSGIVEFAKGLVEQGVTLISTGGTKSKLEEAGLVVMSIDEVTGFPECLDGRVKTLHPKVHGGILGIRDNADHRKQMETLEIETIDMVVVNLYPFKNTVLNPNSSHEDIIENIDIGGPTMIRSAAKNYNDVTVVVDPSDYATVLDMIREHGDTTADFRMELAYKVFEHTSHYDTLIAAYMRKKLNKTAYPETFTVTYEKVQDLRYGENPHQGAAFYKEVTDIEGSLATAKQLHGKELSFNNINDANGALELLKEFTEPTVVAVKHTNPCGVGTGINIFDAYMKAYEADPQSIFGGIIAANRPIDAQTAEKINEIFVEIVIAPAFDEDALEILTKKKNVRIMVLEAISVKQAPDKKDIKKVNGGILVQDINSLLMDGDYEVATERIPNKSEIEDLMFAWKVVKHTKSNAIVLAKNKKTLSVSPGQTSRVWAVENCIKQSLEPIKGGVMASDAYFPFADSIETAAKVGVTAIIQPGGSIRDQESIDAANKYGIAMIFTGMRHFKH
ncbi:MAG: bifunctional phosphoribosylaminoimidazolecarboxamide formyltransferase/IMP cyclohydrolase [Clostridia bacterium]|nr:bifunctional phosphoribosylaminoimidazolecarboxamide formyltransferase/IMP cyclohydrolase [Clostridia bacterium]